MDARILRLLYGEKTKVDPTYMRGYIQVSKTHGYEERENYLFEIEDYHDTGAEKLAKAFNYKKRGQVQVVWDEEAAEAAKKAVPSEEDSLNAEIIKLFMGLTADQKKEALNYLRYLSTKSENP